MRWKEASADEEKKFRPVRIRADFQGEKEGSFYLRLMLGLGSSCGVMVPIEPFFTTLNELSAKAAFKKKDRFIFYDL